MTGNQPLSPERPIGDPEDDRLGRAEFAARLARMLVDPDTRAASGIVVGVTGSWGSGKSSLLNLLARAITGRWPDAVVVRFDPWLVSGRDDLVRSFLKDLHASLTAATGGVVTEKRTAIARSVLEYGKRLVPAAGLVLPQPVAEGAKAALDLAEKLIEAQEKTLEGPSLAELRAKLAGQLAEVGFPIVVLIDELDRVEDAEVRTVAQLVRAVADFPRVSYLLTYDRGRVEEALGGGRTKQARLRGRSYLEKIVQFEIPLPVVVPERLETLLVAEWQRIVPAQEMDAPEDTLVSILVPRVIGTVREQKRVMSAFHAAIGLLRREVNPADLLAFTALRIRSPEVVASLQSNLGTVLGDRLQLNGEILLDEMLEPERSRRADWRKMVEAASQDGLVRELQEFIFDTKRRVGDDGLRYPIPLLKVLHSGNLEGHWRPDEIVDLLEREDATWRREAIISAAAAGRLAELLWAILAFGWRSRRFSSDPHAFPDLLRDLAEADIWPPGQAQHCNRLLAKFMLADMERDLPYSGPDYWAEIIEQQWIGSGRLVLASHVLELTAFLANEVAEADSRYYFRNGSQIEERRVEALNADHLDMLLDRLAAACRDRSTAGELFSLADPTPLRVLRWTDPPRWDGSFEAAASCLLEENEGLDRLVSLFHGTEPPREVVQRVGLADIVPDVDRAFRRLQDRARHPAFASQPEMLQKAYERAWNQLSGRLSFNRSLSRDRDDPEASANP
ncbi:KAP family P-loop NTPase fold protein [Benzoatithermus flavus]|uniref:P-loop NTPase fold protein n=1 Tax=Benzoatithermus flavus TaxID=3108223 RepID=A0ABU8XNV9_9PROT